MSVLFARAGAKVLLADMSEGNAEKTRATIASEGGEASLFAGCATSEVDCRRMAEIAMERYGSIDVLANNIGGRSSDGKAPEVTESNWDRILDRNLKTVLLVSKHVIPSMVESGGGSVTNISSVDGIRAGVRPNLPYAAAKGGVVAMTTHMAVHHGRDNVRVNGIAPAMSYSSQMLSAYEAEPDIREKRRLGAPLGIEGTPWDIAWTALFLASDEARFVSGVTIPVDGGLLAATPLSMRDYMG